MNTTQLLVDCTVDINLCCTPTNHKKYTHTPVNQVHVYSVMDLTYF